MSWIRIDDQFTEHPKSLEAGTLADWLDLKAMCHCAKYLTDGFVSQATATSLSNAVSNDVANDIGSAPPGHILISRLVGAGLWEATEGGYFVHDYLDYNPTKAQVLEERAQNAARQAAFKARRANAQGNGVTNAVTNATTNGVTNALLTRPPTPTPTPIESSSSGGDDDRLEGYLSVSLAMFSNRMHLIGSAQQRDEMVDRLKELYGRAVTEWWEKAIKEAEDNNKRNWSYVRAILDRCLREGVAPDVKQERTNGAGPRGKGAGKLHPGLEAIHLLEQERAQKGDVAGGK